MRASEFITEEVSAKQVFDTCYGTACKLYDEATKKGLEPKLLQVAGYKGKTDDADSRWKKLPRHVWQHYVVVIDDKVLDPSAKQFGNNMPTKYSIDQLSKNWDEVYTIRPKSLTEDENGKLAWRIRFRRFKDLSPLMPERENKIYLMPTDHSALRTFGNLTGKDDEKITKMPTEAYLVSGDARVGDMSIINAIHRELQTTKDHERIEKLKKLYLNTSVPYSQYRPGVFKYPEILAEPNQLTKLDKSVIYNKNTGEIDIKDKTK